MTTGSAALSLNGKEVLQATAEDADKESAEPVSLAKGYNRLELRFTSPAQGDATLRLYWSGEGFGWEPLPPEVLSSRSDEADLVACMQVREGRFLYATLGCARCHALPQGVKLVAESMPEMQHQGAAALDNAGGRFTTAWLAKWLADPRSLRPEATMPQLLQGEDAAQQAVDLASYLGTQKTSAGSELVITGADATRGEQLFRKLGCVTCHHFQEPTQEDELKAPITTLRRCEVRGGSARGVPAAAASALSLDSHAGLQAQQQGGRRPGRLPEARGQGECRRLCTAGECRARRARLFGEVGCASVIAQTARPLPPQARLAPLPRSELTKGCLAEGEAQRGKAPDFGLNAAQRQALAAFLKTDGTSLTRETPAEFTQRQMQGLQCTSCHRRDGAGTRWHQVLEEEGKVPEALPSLTWAGEKLKHEGATRLLAGQGEQRARPWLKSRMPAFPARADMLAQGSRTNTATASRKSRSPRPTRSSPPSAPSCYPSKEASTASYATASASSQRSSRSRRRASTCSTRHCDCDTTITSRWMLNPTRADVVTRMPVFAQDGKTTTARDVLEGDACPPVRGDLALHPITPGQEVNRERLTCLARHFVQQIHQGIRDDPPHSLRDSSTARHVSYPPKACCSGVGR